MKIVQILIKSSACK